MTTKVTSKLSPNEFFQAGGTLTPDFRSYVKRPADDELFAATKASEFCYVLTTRQMGKSSMMVRIALRLEEEGVRTAITDLTNIGADATAEQWYLGLLIYLIRELELEETVHVESWWRENEALSPVQRFTNFLRDVVLTEIEGKVAIFIDEIDTTLKLDFSDDFFAAIRAMYNARATESIYERLTFVLIGVATPTDLMKDNRRTPFNIGRKIDLLPFRLTDTNLNSLIEGLNVFYPREGEFILNRIFYWTDGHPYLTQRLCFTIAEKKVSKSKDSPWTEEEIDKIVRKEFLSETGRGDKNIQFVDNQIQSYDRKEELLTLYRRVYQGETVADSKRSRLHSQLKLSGLVRAKEGYLRTNNRIYRHIFDLDWIKENTQTGWTNTRIIIVAFVIVFLVILGVFGLGGILNSRNQTPEPSITATTVALLAEEDQTATAAAITSDSSPSLTNTPMPTLTDTITSTPLPTPTDTFTPTPMSTLTAAPTPSTSTVPTAVASTPSNIRSAPSDNFESIANVSAGDEVEVLGVSTNNEWLFVKNTEEIAGFADINDFILAIDISSLNEASTPLVAVVVTPASILPEPESDRDRINEIQLDVIEVGEVVNVIGKLANSTSWLYVSNQEGVEGFAAINRLDWPGTAEELERLPTRQP